MSGDGWIDARDREPKTGETVVLLRGDGTISIAKLGADAGHWLGVQEKDRVITHWMPLPPLPERDESKAMLKDVFGGEWKNVLPNGYDCGDVHATVREHMVQVEYMTDDTTLCVTVHYEEEQSTRKALEILWNELREMHESVGGLLDVDRSGRDA